MMWPQNGDNITAANDSAKWVDERHGESRTEMWLVGILI